MKENLEEISNTHEEKALDVIDLSLLEMQSSLYYRYIGSLTTPPCSQNVLWTIVRKVLFQKIKTLSLDLFPKSVTFLIFNHFDACFRLGPSQSNKSSYCVWLLMM